MKDDKKRRNIVARVMGAENKSEAVAAEAKRAGVSTRTVERWVEAASKSTVAVGQPVMSENASPLEKPAENPVLDKLLNEGAQPGKAAEGPITGTEVARAAADAEAFCIDSYNTTKATVGSVLVSWRYTPPLDPTSEEVLKLLRASKAAELAIRANAPKLYPILAKHAGTWGALIFAVVADAFSMMLAIEGMAKAKGWSPQNPKSKGRPSVASVPSPAEYAAQLQPQAPPAPSPATDPQAEKARATIVDAPLPTQEQIDEYNRLAALQAAGVRVG